jgi:LysR family glycine cleavage system transcriptional activator
MFARNWLIPNLKEFYESFPDVPVVIDMDLAMATFKNDGFDAAIRFSNGKGGFDGLDSVLLFHVQVFAVASPAYIADHGKLESLAEPGTHRLIDGTYNVKTGGVFTKWQDVVSGNQIDSTVQHETFPDYDQIFNAAVLGRGIALLPFQHVVEEIASGNLEYANPEPISSPMSCYFVSPADARPNGDLIAFRDWLVDSLKKYGIVENKGPSKTKGLS